jgi:hypothetical protein
MGQKMYFASPDDDPLNADLGPTVVAALAYVVHLVEEAKREHLHESGQYRIDDADDLVDVASVLSQGAAELRRVASLLRGPRPPVEIEED